MKRIPVNECPAGPWLDAAVAEALGHLVVHQLDLGRWFIASDAQAFQDGLQHGEFWENITDPDAVRYCSTMPKYSSRIEAAWELAEKLVQDGHDFYIDNHRTRDGFGWDANLRGTSIAEWKTVSADKAPLAIARAYLKVKGIKYIEVSE